jgi:hypothetical protein
MFINISNHPSNEWSKEQLEAAGNVVFDINLPNTNSHWNDKELRNCVTDMFDILVELTKRVVIIHLMGETDFVAELAMKIYQETDWTVVHSTTEKIVVENEDGTKTSQSKFVQFKESF